jgi:hypothetical protein
MPKTLNQRVKMIKKYVEKTIHESKPCQGHHDNHEPELQKYVKEKKRAPEIYENE